MLSSRLLLLSRSSAAARLISASSSLPSSSVLVAESSSRRWYRGEAGPGVQNVTSLEETLFQAAQPKSEAIRTKHEALPDLKDIPMGSLDAQQRHELRNDVKMDEMNLEIRRKRLIYRAKQRGWLEVDLLLGTWAQQNVPTLSVTELDEFEEFCNQETIDIYNLLTLRVDIPEALRSRDGQPSLVERIQEWAKSSPLGKADPDTYKVVKMESNLT